MQRVNTNLLKEALIKFKSMSKEEKLKIYNDLEITWVQMCTDFFDMCNSDDKLCQSYDEIKSIEKGLQEKMSEIVSQKSKYTDSFDYETYNASQGFREKDFYYNWKQNESKVEKRLEKVKGSRLFSKLLLRRMEESYKECLARAEAFELWRECDRLKDSYKLKFYPHLTLEKKKIRDYSGRVFVDTVAKNPYIILIDKNHKFQSPQNLRKFNTKYLVEECESACKFVSSIIDDKQFYKYGKYLEIDYINNSKD